MYLFEKNQNVPFLKELFGKNIEESLIAADFKVLKNGNKTDFIFNPLSVLTPGKARNFLIFGNNYFSNFIISPTERLPEVNISALTPLLLAKSLTRPGILSLFCKYLQG